MERTQYHDLGRLCMLPVLCWMIWPGVETRFTSFWAGLLYGAAGALDVLDGYLARKLNAVTLLGKFLDPLADKLLSPRDTHRAHATAGRACSRLDCDVHPHP